MRRRRRRVLIGAAVVGGAVLVALLLVAVFHEGGGDNEISGEGSGTVGTRPTAVAPDLDDDTPQVSTSSASPTVPITTAAPHPGTVASAEAPGDGGGSDEDLGVSVGSVTGLYPGGTVWLPVTYANPYSFDIAVTTVKVSASGTTACPSRHLVTGRVTLSPALTVPAGADQASDVRVRMRPTAPDACQGVSFALHLSAEVKRW